MLCLWECSWDLSACSTPRVLQVQSPGCRMGELVGQSPSVSCSVVGTVPRLSNPRTGRPVPQRIMLGGRYSPQATMSVWPKILLILWKKSYRHINMRCDRASYHLVSLLHKKGRRRTIHPLIVGIKNGNQQLLKKGHQIYCGSSWKLKRRNRRKDRPLPQNAGSGRGGAVVIKRPKVAPLFCTQQSHTSA